MNSLLKTFAALVSIIFILLDFFFIGCLVFGLISKVLGIDLVSGEQILYSVLGFTAATIIATGATSTHEALNSKK